MARYLIDVIIFKYIFFISLSSAFSKVFTRGLDEHQVQACTAGCFDCKVSMICINDQPQYTSCVSSQVCDEGSCTDIPLSTTCTCAGLNDGSYVDPYNPNYYYTCLLGEAYFQSCPANEIFSPDKGGCIALPICTQIGCFPITNDCQYFYCCKPNGNTFTQEVEMCASGEVYDEVTGICVGLNFQCPDVGTFPDPIKCDLYHTCNTVSDPNPESLCCPIGQIYNETSEECVIDNGSCQDVGICYDEYWEINSCQKCSTLSEQYSSKSKCSEYFYICVSDGKGGLKAQLAECPADLIYNPDQDYCDMSENVAGCN